MRIADILRGRNGRAFDPAPTPRHNPTMSSEAALRATIVRLSKSIFERGLTPGSSGNISARINDGYLFTPTNACLGFLEESRLSKLDSEGRHVSGDPPTKELPLHFGFYEARPTAGAVVHLHSTYATLLSCLADIDPDDAIPPITPYVVMRVGRVPVIPYTMPGATDVKPLVLAKAPKHPAILLGNHGPVVAAATLEAAVYAIEELEETAKLVMLSRGMNVRRLTSKQVEALEAKFSLR
jgi:3-dehydro-4-phosphotetronate decarboxylase